MAIRPNRTLVGIASVLLMPAAAQAADGPYVSVRGGLAKAQAVTYNVGTTSAVVGGLREGHKIGYEVDAAAGYQLGPLRVEGEVSQKHTRLADVYASSSVTIPNNASKPTSTGYGTFTDPRGKTRTRSVMANVVVSTTNREVFADGNVHFFAGVGAGYAFSRAIRHRAVSGASSYVSGGGHSFAWQVMGGASYDITPKITLDVRYKYFSATNMRFHDSVGRRLAGAQNWNGFLLGATYAF